MTYSKSGNSNKYHDEEETHPDYTSSNEKISSSIFELVIEDDMVGHRQINGSKCKKSKFSSEMDQSESSSHDEEFRKFCRPRTARRNNFESLGLKVKAYP